MKILTAVLALLLLILTGCTQYAHKYAYVTSETDGTYCATDTRDGFKIYLAGFKKAEDATKYCNDFNKSTENHWASESIKATN